MKTKLMTLLLLAAGSVAFAAGTQETTPEATAASTTTPEQTTVQAPAAEATPSVSNEDASKAPAPKVTKTAKDKKHGDARHRAHHKARTHKVVAKKKAA